MVIWLKKSAVDLKEVVLQAIKVAFTVHGHDP